jgi:hypothetical protein
LFERVLTFFGWRASASTVLGKLSAIAVEKGLKFDGGSGEGQVRLAWETTYFMAPPNAVDCVGRTA